MVIAFTCPNCGGTTLNEVATKCTITAELIEIKYGDVEYYGDEEVKYGGIDRFECGDCKYVLRDSNGQKIDTLEDLYIFVKEKGWYIKEYERPKNS